MARLLFCPLSIGYHFTIAYFPQTSYLCKLNINKDDSIQANQQFNTHSNPIAVIFMRQRIQSPVKDHQWTRILQSNLRHKEEMARIPNVRFT